MTGQFDYQIDGDHILLRGELAFGAHPRWRAMLRDLGIPQTGARRRFDMKDVTSLDAAGLGLLMITRDVMAAHGAALVLTRPEGNVRRVLEVSGFAAQVSVEA
jgi:HptB-dependent secretion and biofilm anti anti-sigma factor